MKFLPILLLAYLLSLSCERHDFDDERTGTKQLNPPHPSLSSGDEEGAAH